MSFTTRRTAAASALGGRLRAVRNAAGLSLAGVEAASCGEWRAVVVGSYERGDRSPRVTTLAGLAAFYGVSLAYLVSGETPAEQSRDLLGDFPGEATLGRDPCGRPVLTVAGPGVSIVAHGGEDALLCLAGAYAQWRRETVTGAVPV